MRAQAGLPDASDSVHSAVRKLLARELSRVRAYEAGTRAGVDPEALHRMRTALRRARAALRVFEAGVPHRTRKSLAAELRWLAARLGEVRDLDVQLQALAASDERLSATQRRALQPYRAHLLAERERHRAVLLQALASERYQALLTSLEAFTAGTSRGRSPAAREPIGPAGAVLLQDAVAKLRKRGRALASQQAPPDEALHALRIRAKRVRDTLEFLADMTGKPGYRVTKCFVRLQDRLGAHQDAVVAATQLRAYLDAHSPAPATTRVLRGFVIRAQRRARQARAGFASAWRDLEDEPMRADMRKVLRRLRHATGPEALRRRVRA